MDKITKNLINIKRFNDDYKDAIQDVALNHYQKEQTLFISLWKTNRKYEKIKIRSKRFIPYDVNESADNGSDYDFLLFENVFILATPMVREILRLMLDGFSMRAIAGKHDINASTIGRALKRFSKKKAIAELKK